MWCSRGNPTVEVDVTTGDGMFRAQVPSGASTGIYEAHELRYVSSLQLISSFININHSIYSLPMYLKKEGSLLSLSLLCMRMCCALRVAYLLSFNCFS